MTSSSVTVYTAQSTTRRPTASPPRTWYVKKIAELEELMPGYKFAPEAIQEGGIEMTDWPNDDGRLELRRRLRRALLDKRIDRLGR